MSVKVLLMWDSRMLIDGDGDAMIPTSMLVASNLVVLRESSVIHSNANSGVHEQGSLNLSGSVILLGFWLNNSAGATSTMYLLAVVWEDCARHFQTIVCADTAAQVQQQVLVLSKSLAAVPFKTAAALFIVLGILPLIFAAATDFLCWFIVASAIDQVWACEFVVCNANCCVAAGVNNTPVRGSILVTTGCCYAHVLLLLQPVLFLSKLLLFSVEATTVMQFYVHKAAATLTDNRLIISFAFDRKEEPPDVLSFSHPVLSFSFRLWNVCYLY